MKLTVQIIAAIALAALPAAATGGDKQLGLKHGVYVLAGSACKDAPNAAILAWDGVGFSGAHSSKCASHVTSQGGTRFLVDTTCAAAGDGSANPPGGDAVDSFSLNRLSQTKFAVTKEHQAKAIYRWCAVK